MGVKKYNPVTPGQRFKIVVDFNSLTTSRPEKSLVTAKGRSGVEIIPAK